jgi:hypothetical protein
MEPVVSATGPRGRRPSRDGEEELMPAATVRQTRRLNLVLPEDLYRELQEVADKKHTNIQELIRKFLKLGLLAVEMEDAPDSQIIFREAGVERRVVIL